MAHSPTLHSQLPPNRPFWSTLDPLQLACLKKLWLRLDALVYPLPSRSLDPADKPLEALINAHGPAQFQTALWSWIMMDDPDVMVLKYLRARKWDLTGALKMLVNCLNWRIERDVDAVTENENIRKQLRTGKAFIQGVDRSGCPIARITAARHKTSDQTPQEVEEFVIYTMESIRLFMIPPLETASIMVDLSGFGMSNMDWKCTSFMISCLEAYYPETLNFQIIHNAPWIFQGIWKVISTMLDPVVKSKVLMTQSKDDLVKLIDKSNLFESEGGTSNWKWTCPAERTGTPNARIEDTEARAKELANRAKLAEIYMELTRKWAVLDSSADLDAPKAVELARSRELVRLMLRAHYFKLMPYIKPLTIYHHHKTLTQAQPGIVKFTLNSSTPIGVVEIGQSMARDSVLKMIDETIEEFEKDGIERPAIDFEI